MSYAVITHIAGPLLTARTLLGEKVAKDNAKDSDHSNAFSMYEAVEVSDWKLLGEVIRIENELITIQVYEDTTGLTTGMPVRGHGLPLSVPLGPGILGHAFDGLLRPLSIKDNAFIQRGSNSYRNTPLSFTPLVSPGDKVLAGSRFGVAQSPGVRQQWLLVPSDISGSVTSVVSKGDYAEQDILCEVTDKNGHCHQLSAIQHWPVRTPRPMKQRLPVSAPLITGQRILDSLFPVPLGGKAAVPGGFGNGKTVLLETVAKWCSADIIVYVGCGERGNELTGILEEFPGLVDPRTERSLMERTVIIANTSNMPVAAREASIYTGVTVAEYFRDQGLHVALMTDSTSRWAEALRELSGRLGEIPGEAGYPAYLSSRLADFYERSSRVESLCNQEGSVTILGTVSPPSGDFSEPVTSHTKRYIRSFWALDTERARARMYPAVNPLISYSEDADILARWWQTMGHSEWLEQRRELLSLLEDQVNLERMARIVGKDALPNQQQMKLLCAELVNESFLRQSAYSATDRYASPQRQIAMMKTLVSFYQKAVQAAIAGVDPQQVVSTPLYRKVMRMGEDWGEDALEKYTQLEQELTHYFSELLAQTNSELEGPADSRELGGIE